MKKRLLILLALFVIILASVIVYYILDLHKNHSTNNIYKLNIAIQNDDIEKVQELIKVTNLNGNYIGDDCDVAEGGFIDCLSPLQTGCSIGNYEIVKLLVENGANVNYQDKYIKSTPLIDAVNSDEKIIVNYLIEHGADKTKKDKSGKTALDYAIKSNNKELIQLLQ